MTSVPSPIADALDVPVEKCGVCRHALDVHDVTGRRFCDATQAHALSRNCICRPVP